MTLPCLCYRWYEVIILRCFTFLNGLKCCLKNTIPKVLIWMTDYLTERPPFVRLGSVLFDVLVSQCVYMR